MNSRHMFLALALAGAASLPLPISAIGGAQAASAIDLNQDANRALQTLYRTNPLAQQISTKARAILGVEIHLSGGSVSIEQR